MPQAGYVIRDFAMPADMVTSGCRAGDYARKWAAPPRELSGTAIGPERPHDMDALALLFHTLADAAACT